MTASRVRFGTALARLKGVEHEGQRDLWLAQSEIHTWLGGGGNWMRGGERMWDRVEKRLFGGGVRGGGGSRCQHGLKM